MGTFAFSLDVGGKHPTVKCDVTCVFPSSLAATQLNTGGIPLQISRVLPLCGSSFPVLFTANSSCLSLLEISAASPQFREVSEFHLGFPSRRLGGLESFPRQQARAIVGLSLFVYHLFRDHCPSLPDVQCFENRCLYILSSFLVVCLFFYLQGYIRLLLPRLFWKWKYCLFLKHLRNYLGVASRIRNTLWNFRRGKSSFFQGGFDLGEQPRTIFQVWLSDLSGQYCLGSEMSSK